MNVWLYRIVVTFINNIINPLYLFHRKKIEDDMEYENAGKNELKWYKNVYEMNPVVRKKRFIL